ncbi:MAG: thiamine pyrophosphate-binding protein, partial [Paracoccaceae bacterium]|nr:thiamine pyrophosphate-binding protein [Paracoccaceae bacterium]
MPSKGISGNNLPHGGIILVNQLVQENVTRVFSVPGESFLNVLDGLYDSSIQNIVCRNEGGACFMAEAFGKITGQPGVAFVTRGPGSSNASGGIHTAKQDSTPMVLFIG